MNICAFVKPSSRPAVIAATACLISLFAALDRSSAAVPAAAAAKPRARDVGVPFEGTPGRWNAITDVAGVEVGQVTLISGEGKLVVGRGPVRTGVTVIFPQGRDFRERVFGAWFTLNGNGEMTGTTWLKESGCLGSPIVITNTQSVGVARDAVTEWNVKRGEAGRHSGDFSLPVVAETWDGFLNDIDGFHVRKEDVFTALDAAKTGPVAEGGVGGGTGMVCHEFKGGIGTSSRVLDADEGGYAVGLLVQANYGLRETLTIAGVPVGREITGLMPRRGTDAEGGTGPGASGGREGSIIVVVATDAPLLPHQLERLVKRVALGVALAGGRANDSSGDIFIAFSTANSEAAKTSGLARLTMLPNERIDPLFEATTRATEEAIVNALIAAETMTGVNGNTVYALPHDRLREVLRKYNRLAK